MLLKPSLDIGFFSLPYYFLILSLTFSFSLWWWIDRAQKQNKNLDLAFQLVLQILCVGFVGSRLFHIIYEEPRYYLQHPWDVFAIWKGGFVFFGGALPAIAIAIYTLRKKQQDVWAWADMAVPVFLVGYACGRIASLMAGSCYGRATNVPWAVLYPGGLEAPAYVALHPVAAYEALWSLLLALIFLFFERQRDLSRGAAACWALIGHGLGRWLSEQFRADHRGEFIFYQSVSSWISLILIAVGLFFLTQKRRPS
jgi:phosphatidylglycerol:prolipoprotein diacylglycerol transferase